MITKRKLTKKTNNIQILVDVEDYIEMSGIEDILMELKDYNIGGWYIKNLRFPLLTKADTPEDERVYPFPTMSILATALLTKLLQLDAITEEKRAWFVSNPLMEDGDCLIEANETFESLITEFLDYETTEKEIDEIVALYAPIIDFINNRYRIPKNHLLTFDIETRYIKITTEPIGDFRLNEYISMKKEIEDSSIEHEKESI